VGENDPLSAADTRDGRRWLIGLGISVGFGLFGVVMALLAYFERTKAGAPASRAPTPRGAEAKPDQDVRRRRERHK
jgi:hypothetical protein